MKQRSNRINNGYVGFRAFEATTTGIQGINRDYLQKLNSPVWSRPADWLRMPEMTIGNDLIAGLYAIYSGGSGASGITGSGNFVAFALTGTTYVVDWGDGITSRHTSGTTAQHIYYYEGVSAGTLSTEGYRQALMQAYPEITGRTFSTINFGRRYTQTGFTLSSLYGANLKSLKICAGNVTTLTLMGNAYPLMTLEEFEYFGPSGLTTTNALFQNDFRQLKIVKGRQWTSKVLNFTSMFNTALALEYVDLLDTSSGTNFTSMFQNCLKIRTIPPLDLSKATNLTGMFSLCVSLEDIPSFDTSLVQSFSSMFSSCYSLKIGPMLSMKSATNISGMYQNCSALKSIPAYDTSNVQNFSSMFNNCPALYTIPWIDTSNGTNFSTMFQTCQSLEYIPNLDLRKGTNLSSMFSGASSLPTVPFLNVPAATTLASMFSTCSCLRSIPGISGGAVTTMNTMFQNCYGLQFVGPISCPLVNNVNSMFTGCNSLNQIPFFNIPGVTAANNLALAFNGCPSLRSGCFTGVTATISYAGCNLSAAALNDAFNGLGTGGTGKTITITNNWGATACDTTLATSKGWSVTI